MDHEQISGLVVIADDLTGALDATAPFRGSGLTVAVATGPDAFGEALARGASVTAVSTRSREVPAWVAAARMRDALAPNGVWLSLSGNADNRDPETGGPDTRPYPRISLTDLVTSCEPYFEIIEATHQPFGAGEDSPRAWALAMRRRAEGGIP